MLLGRCLMLACATLFLSPAAPAHAQEPARIKPPIRGLISMGAYTFVGEAGDPENTLKQLDKKPGIFGGIVIIATWSQLQPRRNATIGDDMSSSGRSTRCGPTTGAIHKSRWP